MRMLSSVLLAITLLGSFAMPTQAQKLDPDVKTLVQGNDDFALRLYQQIAAEEGNLFFSTYSISNALAMTYAGARGNTAAQMKTTLCFKLPDARLAPAFGKLIAQLDGDGKPRPFQLTVANRLWGQKNYGFLPEFLKIGKEYYRAGLEEVDFINATESARNTINTWVEKQTKDKIKNEWHWSVIGPNTKSLRHITLRYLSVSTQPSRAWAHEVRCRDVAFLRNSS